MHFLEAICDSLTRVLGLTAVSQWVSHDPVQKLFVGDETGSVVNDVLPVVQASALAQPPSTTTLPDGPVFKPPNAGENFYCNYSSMKGWRHTASSESRTAWLEKPISAESPTGGIYDILTDYDEYWPTGIVRKVELNVTDFHINADGVTRRAGGKAFNHQYPGPWIEACWGDWLEITVYNNLRYNGTTIHWHGVRQLESFEQDGVNGVTQCPIAPQDHFTYKFRVTQYGTSWYHSHYSLQYPDGLAGPMTFHGPSSADYDVAIAPFLFSDWSHNSAFEDFSQELHGKPPLMSTVILNGKGFFNCTLANETECDDKTAPKIFEQVFERGRKYLLRLINTSTATTFIFSIDKHVLKVVSADFVAIEPYYTDSVLVGIGQRYHVIVEANPSNSLIPTEDQNYWIRIVHAVGCGNIAQPNELLGIVRYDSGSRRTPVSAGYQFSTQCADEPYESLVPVVPRTVTTKDQPANNISNDGDNFYVGLETGNQTFVVPHGNFSRWDILDTPMWLDFGNPTINHYNDGKFNPAEYAIITENHDKNDWIYLIISATNRTDEISKNNKQFFPVAHPIHLHGHDFVLLSQQSRRFDPKDLVNGTFNYQNPPRRDVALLPAGGYIAIGFKTDNPGIWLIHCHIAWHASSGLGLQIRERNEDIILTPEITADKDRICTNWTTWYNNTANWWSAVEFQEDSGV